jgi:hypothetical protein
MGGDQRVQGGDPVEPLRQPPACQHPACIVDDFDIVVVLGPVISHEQHQRSLPLGHLQGQQHGGDSRRSNGQVLPSVIRGTTSQ